MARCAACGQEIPGDAHDGACPACALAAALPGAGAGPTADEVAAKLPGFEILGILGRGGMGVVFKARQKALDRIVALKVLPPESAAAPGFADRFQREAKAMARLSHPNIVAVHDFGASEGLFFLVLEFVDGPNIREAMAAGRVAPDQALRIVPQICDALQYAHDRGVVHRDVKPENVLIAKDGNVKIADFGLAKLADRDGGDPSLTGAGQVMGTVRYMAPEQWEHPKDVDHRADIYSLGVVFYEMLTGELPVGKFEPPSRKAAIDVRVDEVVMRSIERDRERRWQSASDVKSKVGEIASGAAFAAPRSGPAQDPIALPAPVPGAHPPSLVPIVLSALVAILAAVVAVATDAAWILWLVPVPLIYGIVRGIQRHEEMRRLGLLEPDWSDIERRKEALDPPRPRGPVLPQRAVALVAGAGVAACAVLANPAILDFEGSDWVRYVTPMFVLGLVLWTLYDSRKTAVRDAERGERDAPGAPIAIEIIAVCMMVLGGFAVCREFVAPREERTTSRSAPAAWEFETSAADGEDPARRPRDIDRQAIWRTWTRAQAVQGAWSSDVREVYVKEDGAVLDRMLAAQRDERGRTGVLGPPLLAVETAPLSEFGIVRARFGGWDDARRTFTDAAVEATDGDRTLRFSMRLDPVSAPAAPSWAFLAAPVEIR